MQRSKKRKMEREQSNHTLQGLAPEKLAPEKQDGPLFPLLLSLTAVLTSCVLFAIFKGNEQFVGMGWIFWTAWGFWAVLCGAGAIGWGVNRKSYNRKRWRWFYAPIMIVLSFSFSILLVQYAYSLGVANVQKGLQEKYPQQFALIKKPTEQALDPKLCPKAMKDQESLLSDLAKNNRPPLPEEFSFALNYTAKIYQQGCDKKTWRNLRDFVEISDKKWQNHPVQNRMNAAVQKQWPDQVIGCIYEGVRAGIFKKAPICGEKSDRFCMPD